MLKKYLLGIIIGTSILAGTIFAQDIPNNNSFYYGEQYQESTPGTENTDLGKIIKEDSISNGDVAKQDSLLYKIRQFFRVAGGDTYEGANQKAPATAYIKMILNLLLGLVSFISLILVIFAFYLIFFEKGEEGVKKAKKILSGVAIAIVLIGLSRIIVNALFTLYTDTAIQNI